MAGLVEFQYSPKEEALIKKNATLLKLIERLVFLSGDEEAKALLVLYRSYLN